MTNNKELKKCIGMFCPHYHGFVSWPCPSYVLELWCQNCTFYSVGWAVLCTMARSSTGYGTRRARGGRYVHLQHRARTATDYTDSAGRDMQRLYFLCYLMLNVLTCYIKWWWPDAAAAASSGRVSKYHFTEQENCWKQFLLKLLEVHYDYTSI